MQHVHEGDASKGFQVGVQGMLKINAKTIVRRRPVSSGKVGPVQPLEVLLRVSNHLFQIDILG